MYQTFQSSVDSMLSYFGIIPSLTMVIFPMTFLTFFLVSWFDSSTTVKRGIKLFFYIGAPLNIVALLCVIGLTYSGLINHTYVETTPHKTVSTYVETIQKDTLIKDNAPNKTLNVHQVHTTADITLTDDNTLSDIEHMNVGDAVTVNAYAAKDRNLFTPADDVTLYTLTIKETLDQ